MRKTNSTKLSHLLKEWQSWNLRLDLSKCKALLPFITPTASCNLLFKFFLHLKQNSIQGCLWLFLCLLFYWSVICNTVKHTYLKFTMQCILTRHILLNPPYQQKHISITQKAPWCPFTNDAFFFLRNTVNKMSYFPLIKQSICDLCNEAMCMLLISEVGALTYLMLWISGRKIQLKFCTSWFHPHWTHG